MEVRKGRRNYRRRRSCPLSLSLSSLSFSSLHPLLFPLGNNERAGRSFVCFFSFFPLFFCLMNAIRVKYGPLTPSNRSPLLFLSFWSALSSKQSIENPSESLRISESNGGLKNVRVGITFCVLEA